MGCPELLGIAALIGLFFLAVRWVLAPYPSKAEAKEVADWMLGRTIISDAQLKTLNAAWEFYFWCDAVHENNFADPSERFKIERGDNGRWFVKVYAGVRPTKEFWDRLLVTGTMPIAVPSREHAWTQIGGDYGFSFQEEALDFFREFILAPADLKFDGEGIDLK